MTSCVFENSLPYPLVPVDQIFDEMLARVEENAQVQNEISGLSDTRRQVQ